MNNSPRETMNKILVTLAFTLVTAHIEAQLPTNVPKLVVGITVDELRLDYLEWMREAFGEDGFNRILNEGALYENVSFHYPNLDRATAVATIHTGAYPRENGIIANTRYNANTDRVESILYDDTQIGNYSSLTVSPRNLLTSTLSDELAMASDKQSQIYAIAPTFEEALLAGGHAANAAFWIDNQTGKWATTTYYKDIPRYVELRNQHSSLTQRIDDLSWSLMLPIHRYNLIPYNEKDFSFKHIFSKSKEAKYTHFKTSGLVNEEVTALACEFITKGALGTHHYPDMLNIGYNAANYRGVDVQQYSLEIQDTYLRLDQSIAQLLRCIDQTVGLENALIYIASTGHFSGEGAASERYQIPSGEFYPQRACSLLNAYLMAIYGQGNWVLGYHNEQIYLNRTEIQLRNLSLNEMQEKSAEFILEMSGVQDVVTSHRLLHGNWSIPFDKERNGYSQKLSGDLLLDIQSGWYVVYEDVQNTRYQVRDSAIPAPLFFFGKNIKPQHIARPIEATQIAPTVARILRIRSPNGASQQALPEVR